VLLYPKSRDNSLQGRSYADKVNVALVGLGGFIVLESGSFSQINMHYGAKLLLPTTLQISSIAKALSLLATSA
jgi:hypothetical protein